MIYNFKKAYFFLSAVIMIPFLLFWLLYDLYDLLDFIYPIMKALGLRLVFEGDGIIGYFLITLVLLPLNAIIYLIFYRRECSVWPKLLILFTGTVNAFTSLQISSAIFTAQFQDGNSAIGWKLLLAAYAAIALAAIVWLIIAMVKYPKPAPKAA